MAEDIFPTTEDLEDAEFFDPNVDEDFLSEEEEPPTPLGFTWKFDFNKGDIFTDSYGRMVQVQDRAVLHEWIGHTLSTERFETPIYGGDIGTSINGLIGKIVTHDPHTLALVEKQIREAIMVHDRVSKVEKVAVIPLDYDVFVYIRVTMDDETVIQEVVNF